MAPLDYRTGSAAPSFGHTLLKHGVRGGAIGETGAGRPQFHGAYAHSWSLPSLLPLLRPLTLLLDAEHC
jgi:hypothetical protein